MRGTAVKALDCEIVGRDLMPYFPFYLSILLEVCMQEDSWIVYF